MDRSNSNGSFTSLDMEDSLLKPDFAKNYEALNLKLQRMTAKLAQISGQDYQQISSLNVDINETGDLMKQLAREASSSAERQRLKKIAGEYSRLLDRIEQMDRKMIAKSTQRIHDLHDQDHEPELEGSLLEEQTLLTEGINHEIEYNERIIRERESEIRDISRASALINELFQNIGVIVHEQQDLIDNIEVNAQMTRDATRKATGTLERTHRQHQRRTSKICFYSLLAILALIFIFTVLSSL